MPVFQLLNPWSASLNDRKRQVLRVDDSRNYLYSCPVRSGNEWTAMAIQTNYTRARANLAKLCSRVADNRETVIINRRGLRMWR